METLNFNHLYYFVVIAKEGSVSKACKRLFVTQPTLSGQLRQLEDFFGHKLFDRKKKRLFLNKQGEIVLQYATQIFKLRDEMISTIRHEKKDPIIKVSVGVLPSLSKSHVFEFVLDFWKRENVEVNVQEGAMKDLVANLRGGLLDVVLTDSMVTKGGDKLGNDRLFSRDIIAVASPTWKSVKKNFPKSLHNRPFINFTKHSRLRDDIDLFFYSNHIAPLVMGEMDDASLLRLAAQSGRFFAILPRNAAKEALDSGKLIELGKIGSFGSDLWAISRKGGYTPEIVRMAIDHCKRQAKLRRQKGGRSSRTEKTVQV